MRTDTHTILSYHGKYQKPLSHMMASYKAVSQIPANKRLEWAFNEESHNIKRDGWFLNTPVGANGDCENIYQHAEHMTKLIKQYFPEQHHARMIELANYHDLLETVIHARIDGNKRDLNRFNKVDYSITDQDKQRLEDIGEALLFENHPELLKRMQDSHTSKHEADRWFWQLDKAICVVDKALEYMESGKYDFDDFQDYWNYWDDYNVRDKCDAKIISIYEDHIEPRINKLRAEKQASLNAGQNALAANDDTSSSVIWTPDRQQQIWQP